MWAQVQRPLILWGQLPQTAAAFQGRQGPPRMQAIQIRFGNKNTAAAGCKLFLPLRPRDLDLDLGTGSSFDWPRRLKTAQICALCRFLISPTTVLIYSILAR